MTTSTTYSAVVWTKQGLAKLLSASQQGLDLPITHVSAGSEAYTPSDTQTSLRQQQQIVPIGGAEELNNNQLRFSALFDGELTYDVKEIGIWSEQTLVAVYSIPNQQLNHKAANAAWVEMFTLDVSALPTQNIHFEVGVNNANIFMAEELANLTHAQLLQGKNLIQQAHSNMLIEDRLRKAGF
ncbi:hypothetical protein PCIT_a2960 [Pseudoalteromonas citrea]|uniref:Phage tail fibre protein N-terminal domain-containing protein n=2 Tax=Pseudoalteromonas citrea TaxID=43655 RepID=A0AAD4FRL2_9GAMM|nr:phage tail protein [Pseudoalteromonas citrea]KAF7770018.1 hypothetical protein PCIT_a2960 [Pseudoalteromonas citrea]